MKVTWINSVKRGETIRFFFFRNISINLHLHRLFLFSKNVACYLQALCHAVHEGE